MSSGARSYPWFGSDDPHPEGLAEPRHCADAPQRLSVEDQTRIKGCNLAPLMSV
jgi:hypothetical protein